MRALLSNLMSSSVALGLILSPESLAKLGNGLGQGGTTFLALLALAAFLQTVNALSYDRLNRFLSSGGLESYPMGALTGPWIAASLPLIARVPAFACLGTAVLATAGFVFNEVFAYWFPNFAFAFLVLVLLALTNVVSPRAALLAQTVFAGAAVTGLLGLSFASLSLWNSAPSLDSIGARTAGFPLAGLPLVLLAGFELSHYAPPADPDRSANRPASRSVVMLCACLFFLWGLVSLHFVPMDRLAGSSVPHMLTARLIWGETGRSLMGAVVLAGCCGVVNGSFLALTGLLSHGPETGASEGRVRGSHRAGRVGVLLLAAALAAALGTGMAGESLLDTWIRGALLLWLLGYAAFQGALFAMALGRRTGPERFRASLHGLLSLLLLGVVAASVWTDPERNALVVFMILAPLALSLILTPWCRSAVGRNRGA